MKATAAVRHPRSRLHPPYKQQSALSADLYPSPERSPQAVAAQHQSLNIIPALQPDPLGFSTPQLLSHPTTSPTKPVACSAAIEHSSGYSTLRRRMSTLFRIPEDRFGQIMKGVLSPSQAIQTPELLKGRDKQLDDIRRSLYQEGRQVWPCCMR